MLRNRESRPLPLFGQHDMASSLALTNPSGSQESLYCFFAGDVGECAHAPRLVHVSLCVREVYLWKSGYIRFELDRHN